ncbi:MAG TPA: cupredoxin family copper-binding protein [Steroidobacteraceae bacterium]|nr:cupredoxin family copper-binding protein [Steroidobacteraceae bacterium]
MSGTSVRFFLILLMAASVTGLVPAIGAAAGAGPVTHQVTIDGVRFDPQELTVRAGDTIVWSNHDPFPHTATAVGRQFNSREIASGRSWKFTARKKGVFAYACLLHPTMLGTLRVE